MALLDSLRFKVRIWNIGLRWFVLTIAVGLTIKVTSMKKHLEGEIKYK